MILTHLYFFFFGKKPLLFRPFLSEFLKYKTTINDSLCCKAEVIDTIKPISKQKDLLLFSCLCSDKYKYIAEVSDV